MRNAFPNCDAYRLIRLPLYGHYNGLLVFNVRLNVSRQRFYRPRMPTRYDGVGERTRIGIFHPTSIPPNSEDVWLRLTWGFTDVLFGSLFSISLGAEAK